MLLASATFVLGIVAGATLVPVAALHSSPPPPAAPAVRAEEAPAAELRSAHPAQVLRVIDGDTFEARVRVWQGLDITTKVRLRGIDAPELSARCADERVKAEAARAALEALLAEGAVGISRIGLDKYGGRVVADASTRRTADVSAALLNAGVARSYTGGRRESWC